MATIEELEKRVRELESDVEGERATRNPSATAARPGRSHIVLLRNDVTALLAGRGRNPRRWRHNR